MSEAKPKKQAKRIFIGLLAAAVLCGSAYALLTMGTESTDNAQIEGHVLSIAARVAGQVERVLVDDNQQVHQGDLLVELDTSEFAARVDAAKGDAEAAAAAVAAASSNLELTETNIAAGLQQAQGGLVQAESGLNSSRAALTQARADVGGAESRFHLAMVELRRTQQLFNEGVAAQAELDAKQSQYDQSQASLAQAKAHLENIRAAIAGSSGGIATAKGKLEAANSGPQQLGLAKAALEQAKARQVQADAALKLAELNLSFAQVKAPFDGIVSKRSVEPGQLVGPDKALLAIISTKDQWVTANFKEDQIAAMRPGQSVTFTVDAYGRRKFHGEIDSIASATGARFSLLPPDNSSGNFIKVTQRIPVRIKLLGEDQAALRIGMSVDVTVNTASQPKPAAPSPAPLTVSVGQK